MSGRTDPVAEWDLVYVDDPGPTPPSLPFRCSECGQMQHERGKWVHRWEGVPGHFMAVCDDGVGCHAPLSASASPRRRWWQR